MQPHAPEPIEIAHGGDGTNFRAGRVSIDANLLADVDTKAKPKAKGRPRKAALDVTDDELARRREEATAERAAQDARNTKEREKLGFGDRLRRRREDMSLTQTDVANALGLTRAAIAQWESHSTSPTVLAIRNLARVLEVKPEWLLFGIESRVEVQYKPVPGQTLVTEVKIVGDDQGGYEMEPQGETIWGLPTHQLQLLHHVSDPDRCVMLEVPDDSMGPDFEYGDRVIVDLQDTKPTTGVYVIWNGVAGQLYHLQVVPRSGNVPTLRMRNKTAEPIDCEINDVQVIGKVKGRWSR